MNDKIRILCENTSTHIDVAPGTSLLDSLKLLDIESPHPMLAATVNNCAKELNYKIFKPLRMRLYDITSNYGFRVYQRTLMFIAQRAVEQLYPDHKLHIRYAIGDALYCELGQGVKIGDE